MACTRCWTESIFGWVPDRLRCNVIGQARLLYRAGSPLSRLRHRRRGEQIGNIAEAHHRDHAIIEQVIADLKSSALKHFPSGSFNANGAWLACAVMAYNLSRAAGVLAGRKLGKARPATIRSTVINIPARLAFSAGSYTLHLPANSRRQDRFITMFDAIQAPPKAA